MNEDRAWVNAAVQLIEADFARSADTHLIPLPIPGAPDIHLYFKDETTHPTGSLKHRLAYSLFIYGLCNGWIKKGTTIIEASSGSTAVSEAYFARLLGLPFIAVMPKGTSSAKIGLIEFYGGECHLVNHPSEIYSTSHALAEQLGGHFVDQFTYAERATDWRGKHNVAASIFAQMQNEPHPQPTWLVCSAGTGGSAATLSRHRTYAKYNTNVCVVDPDNSVFYDYYHSRDKSLTLSVSSGIEGIGRPRVEPSFIPDAIDRMIKVPNVASLAAIYFLEMVLRRKCGGSTGCNLYGAFQLIAEMKRNGQAGSVVTLICDAGERYLTTYYDEGWLQRNGYQIDPYLAQLEHFYATGEWVEPIIRH